MKSIEGSPDVRVITATTVVDFSKEKDVYGYSFFVDSSSQNASVSFNDAPAVPILAGGPSIPIGGMSIGDCPVRWTNKLKFQFDAADPLNKIYLIIIHVPVITE
jgi:hypothetical protein